MLRLERRTVGNENSVRSDGDKDRMESIERQREKPAAEIAYFVVHFKKKNTKQGFVSH